MGKLRESEKNLERAIHARDRAFLYFMFAVAFLVLVVFLGAA